MTLAKREISKRPLPPADMVTLNRAQMAAAIKAVPYRQRTIIEAINNGGRVLVRYTFPGKLNTDKRYHERHINKLARQVMKTPAAAWR